MFHVSVGSVATIFLILVPLAFFICSVMMSIALLARSFREAQNYVTPFFIFIMLPGMIAAMPGMELSRTTMFIPIANVALLLKDLLMEKATLELTFGVFLCTGVYALLSLVVAVWMFQREDVILSQDKGIPLTFRRSALRPRDQATPGQALLLFAMALLMLFYAAMWVQVRWGIWGLFITQWALLLAPALGVLWLGRVNLRTSLSLRRPPHLAWPGVVLMAAGMLVVVLQVHVWQSSVLPVPEEASEQMSRALGLGQVVLLLGAAVSPAICEEVLFRGGILSGLRGRLPAWARVVVVGLLFGLFHLSVHRVLPTALLGIAITYVAVRSRSIFPAMLFHLLHNTTILLAGTDNLPAPLMKLMNQAEAGGFSAWVVAVAVAAVAAGAACMEYGARSAQPSGPAPEPE
jgi:sodium transport system permease protein